MCETYGGEGGEGERRIRNVKYLEMNDLVRDTVLERGVPFGVVSPGWAGDLIGLNASWMRRWKDLRKHLWMELNW